jgi:hypothetical protein
MLAKQALYHDSHASSPTLLFNLGCQKNRTKHFSGHSEVDTEEIYFYSAVESGSL